MLLALGAIGLVAIGLLLALLVTHRGKTTSTTVLVTTSPAAQQTTAPTTAPVAPARVAVPDLVGGSLADAQTRLRRAGLGVAVTQVTSGRRAGTIVDQAPKPGEKIAKHRVVTLSVARTAVTVTTGTTNANGTTTGTATPAPTPANATMPDVGGRSEQSAVTAVNRASLLASLFFVPSDDPLGTVEQQAKPSGTTLPYHAHVQLNISRGPGQKEDVQVPDVVGRSLTDAVSALNGAKLRLIYVRFPVTASSQIGKVVQQSPLAGGKAPQNAQVLVFLGVKGR
jgi:eukaryotic-like serine/threonine-protein kinase